MLLTLSKAPELVACQEVLLIQRQTCLQAGLILGNLCDSRVGQHIPGDRELSHRLQMYVCQANISRNSQRGRKLEKQAGMEFEGRAIPFRHILPESGNGIGLYVLCAYTNPLPKIQDTMSNIVSGNELQA